MQLILKGEAMEFNFKGAASTRSLKATPESREAFGLRAACCRFCTVPAHPKRRQAAHLYPKNVTLNFRNACLHREAFGVRQACRRFRRGTVCIAAQKREAPRAKRFAKKPARGVCLTKGLGSNGVRIVALARAPRRLLGQTNFFANIICS
jgi:hypothetical protein